MMPLLGDNHKRIPRIWLFCMNCWLPTCLTSVPFKLHQTKLQYTKLAQDNLLHENAQDKKNIFIKILLPLFLQILSQFCFKSREGFVLTLTLASQCTILDGRTLMHQTRRTTLQHANILNTSPTSLHVSTAPSGARDAINADKRCRPPPSGHSKRLRAASCWMRESAQKENSACCRKTDKIEWSLWAQKQRYPCESKKFVWNGL